MSTNDTFSRRALIVFAIATVLFLAWKVAPVLLLAFGGIVFATVIRVAADALMRWLPISERWASVLVIVLTIALLALAFYFFGKEIQSQFDELRRRLPPAFQQARAWLESVGLGGLLDGGASAADDLSLSSAVGAASSTINFLVDLILVALVALFVSFNPSLYRRGALALMPESKREQGRTAFDAATRALRGWLIGQLASMTTVGILTGLGLWLVGVPLPLALGLIAGLLEFVPFLGPWIAAVPGVLLAFTVGPTTALWTALLYLVVQQLESNIIMPIAQKWAVRLPPALGVVTVIVFATLFGISGLLFAVPLTVVIVACVRALYLERRPV